MIRLQIVDLLPEHERPHFLAEKFDHVQRIRKSRPVSRKPTCPISFCPPSSFPFPFTSPPPIVFPIPFSTFFVPTDPH